MKKQETSHLRLRSTLSKKEEEFLPQSDHKVTMYTCGPTVYGRPHIGNLSSFLMADLLRRWLQAGHGYDVMHVKNITDVGHLVADRDEGEDKVEKEARKKREAISDKREALVTGDDVLAVAEKYTEQYLEDERALNMREPAARPRATETIQEMLAMVKDLLAKEHAYETADGIYYDITSFPQYGELSGNTLDKIDVGARIEVKEEKRHPADFALWKKCVDVNAEHLLRWSFETGERVSSTGEDASAGFPGWHIECSAMSRKHLKSDTIDIHTGGEDNIFPHHECEIAQSEAVTGKPFVRYWLHKRRIDLQGEKMSKSLGNVLTLPDVVAKGFSPMDLRYYFLSVHYRTNLKFSWKGIEDARKARLKIVEWMDNVMVSLPNHGVAVHGTSPIRQAQGDVLVDADYAMYIKQFRSAMDSDLNTPAALAVVFDCMAASRNKTMPAGDRIVVGSFITLIKDTFGCFDPEDEEIPAGIIKLAKERDEARITKDFAASDRIRDELIMQGYEVRDTEEGTRVKRR